MHNVFLFLFRESVIGLKIIASGEDCFQMNIPLSVPRVSAQNSFFRRVERLLSAVALVVGITEKGQRNVVAPVFRVSRVSRQQWSGYDEERAWRHVCSSEEKPFQIYSDRESGIFVKFTENSWNCFLSLCGVSHFHSYQSLRGAVKVTWMNWIGDGY